VRLRQQATGRIGYPATQAGAIYLRTAEACKRKQNSTFNENANTSNRDRTLVLALHGSP